MKKVTIPILLLILFVSNVSAGQMDRFLKGFQKEQSLRVYKKKDLKNTEIKVQAAFIYTILANTNELRIHQMRGATTNQVFLHSDGHKEAVFEFDLDAEGEIIDGTGRIVDDCINKASYNYYHPQKKAFGHFSGDILPWILMGNCREDPTSINERIEAYMLDFEMGMNASFSSDMGFFLPEKFKFKEFGQSEAFSFFLRSLDASGFDLGEFVPSRMDDLNKRRAFVEAIETGFKQLLNE